MKIINILIASLMILAFVGCDSDEPIDPTPIPPVVVDPTPIPPVVVDPTPIPDPTIIIMDEFKSYNLEAGDKLVGENAIINLVTITTDGETKTIVELMSGKCNIETIDLEDKIVNWDEYTNKRLEINTNYNLNQTDVVIVYPDIEMDVMLDNEGLFSTVKIINGSVTLYEKKEIDPLESVDTGITIN